MRSVEKSTAVEWLLMAILVLTLHACGGSASQTEAPRDEASRAEDAGVEIPRTGTASRS